METLKDQQVETANQLVQEVKDLHGKLYHKVFSLNAENLRLSLKVRNLEGEINNYYTKSNQIESTSLSHEAANKKAILIAMLFLPPMYHDTKEFGRALDGVYNILRAK